MNMKVSGGRTARKIRLCAYCDNVLKLLGEPGKPVHKIVCRHHGFRRLDETCGKWKAVYPGGEEREIIVVGEE